MYYGEFIQKLKWGYIEFLRFPPIIIIDLLYQDRFCTNCLLSFLSYLTKNTEAL